MNDLPRPGYCPKGASPCHILEGESALDYSGRCFGCGDKRAITFDEENQAEGDAARAYLIKEGLDPDQLVKEGLVFINSIHERIRLEALNKELLEAMQKYVHHWDLFFNSPKVGQPPSLEILKNAIEKARGTNPNTV